MDKSDETAIAILLGMHILNKAYSGAAAVYDEGVQIKRAVVPAIKRGATRVKRAVADPLERGGARVYDALHNDSGHERDLPGKQLTRQAVLAIAKNAGFSDPKLATAIALAESGGVPNALNRTSREVSVGLWQINTMSHPYSADDMRDPIKNARAAFRISRGGRDWSAWAAFTKGRYRQFQTGILAP